MDFLSTMRATDAIYLVVLAVIAYKFFADRKRLKTLLDTVQKQSNHVELQTTRLQTLEQELTAVHRPRVGIIAKWAPARSDESAYTLIVHNDTFERIFNVTLTAPKGYDALSVIRADDDQIDANTRMIFHFLPNRVEFAHKWLTSEFKQLFFTLTYTDDPSLKAPKSIQVPFTVFNVAKHFGEYLKLVQTEEENSAAR